MFRVTAREGCARTGILSWKGQDMATPALLLYTRKGSPLNLTPDLVDQLGAEAKGLHIDATHFVESPVPAKIHSAGGNGRTYLAQPERLLLATTRDATAFAYPRWNIVYANGVRVEASSGVVELSPSRYQSVIDALQPDLYCSLVDEITWEASRKRAVASVNRTLKWLDELLSSRQSSAGEEGRSSVLAPVTGGSFVEERRRSALEASKRNVAGFVLSGFGCGEDAEGRLEHLQAAVGELPEDLPRMLVGPAGSPDEVLDAVCCGMDLFDTGYAILATQAGYALTFAVDSPTATGNELSPANTAGDTEISDGPSGGPNRPSAIDLGSDDTKINLWAEGYRRDPAPLLAGCECYTCKHHSRAYVHHLLMSHEMLAQTLLELHNTHHSLRFFRAIRIAIGQGTLAALRTRVARNKNVW